MPSKAEIIKQAIRRRHNLAAWYQGHPREFSPHSIGWDHHGHYHVFAWQFAGGSSQRLPPQGEWRCFLVEELTQLARAAGRWRSDPSWQRPNTCVTRVELEVGP